MVGPQPSPELECPLDYTWLELEDSIWEDFVYEDLACEDETQYGNDPEEHKPESNLREQPAPFSKSRCPPLLVILIKS